MKKSIIESKNTKATAMPNPDETELLFSPSYTPMPNTYEMYEANQKILRNEEIDDTNCTMYCQVGNNLEGYPLSDFFTLAEGSSPIQRSAGTAVYATYFLHIPTQQVYELIGDDYHEECIATLLGINAQQVFRKVRDEFEWSVTYQSAYRSRKIDLLLDAML